MTSSPRAAIQPAAQPMQLDPDALRRVTRRRLADDIVEQIRGLIAAEGLDEGTRLPAERELAVRCGSSRAVVAQALRTLSLMGLVEIRPGSGAYVARNPATMVTASLDLLVGMHHGTLAELCELRLWLETDGALGTLRALGGHGSPDASPSSEPEGRADASLEADIAGALGRIATCVGVSTFVAADTNFHALLVAGAGNPYLTTLYESVHTAILSVEYDRWVHDDDAPAWLTSPPTEDHVRLHRPIADALSLRSEAAMRRALGDHHRAMLGHLGITPDP